MKKLNTSIVQDGSKNTILQISGIVDSPPSLTEVLVFGNLRQPFSSLKIQAITFMIQEKMGCHLFWTMRDGSHVYMVTLESRGRADFESATGLRMPEDSKGVAMSIFKWEKETPMGLMILIDMDKT
jgi:hypothetical protein